MLNLTDRLEGYLVIFLAGLVGGVPLLLFMMFLYFGPFIAVDLRLNENMALLLDTILCLVFFFQHSIMIRKSSRQRMANFIPSQYVAAFFAIVSGIFLFVFLFLWQEVSYSILAPQGILRLVFRTIFFLSLAVFAWGLWALGEFDPFGIIPIISHLRGTKKPGLPFIAKGPYRYVRHPLYSAMILMFWSYPILTLDRLLFNCLFTTWMVIGTFLEERDLVDIFGPDYFAYQKRVPMLFPYRLSLTRKITRN